MDRGNESIEKKGLSDIEVESSAGLELPEKEIDPELEALKKRIKDVKEKMDLAQQKLDKKKEEISRHSSVFKKVLWAKFDLQEVDKELAGLEKECEDITNQYEQLASEYEEKKKKLPVPEKIGGEHEAKTEEIAGDGMEKVDDMDGYEKFIGERKIEIQRIAGERQSIFDEYPELADIADFDGKMDELKQGIAPEQAVDEVVQEKIKKLDRLRELRKNFEKAYIDMFMAFIDMKNIGSLRLNMNARDYISEHGQDNAVKVFDATKKTISSGQAGELSLDPHESETVMAWSKRVVDAIMNNLSRDN